MNHSTPSERRDRTVASALWSAYGDAIGFTTELADASLVKRRSKLDGPITTTVAWQRLVGGRFGAFVDLPAGAYSDDTQLRLATSRSIRSDGFFDVESFAKIELTAWLAYALGGGLGSKAAATSLCSNSKTWYSNFFRTDKSIYVNGGGNGAAMRVQPHVWASSNLNDPRSYLDDVVRNSITTHGHVRGIAGAMIHAEVLAFVMRKDVLPGPDKWKDLGGVLNLLPEIIKNDNDLNTFWLPTWQKESGCTIQEATDIVVNEWVEICTLAERVMHKSKDDYVSVVKSLGGLKPEERGSGIKTSLFSLCAAWTLKDFDPSESLAIVANLLNSDTDTIATMAGALIGALPGKKLPKAEIQDFDYIKMEAMRLFDVSQNKCTQNFSYPDLLFWQPPKYSLDALTLDGGNLILRGLGPVEVLGEDFPTRQGGTKYQWFQLLFGQTVLCKLRSKFNQNKSKEKVLFEEKNITQVMQTNDLFQSSRSESNIIKSNAIKSNAIESNAIESNTMESYDSSKEKQLVTLEVATDEAIHSAFNPIVIGRQLLLYAEAENGLELAIAYSAIVVKARKARLMRKK